MRIVLDSRAAPGCRYRYCCRPWSDCNRRRAQCDVAAAGNVVKERIKTVAVLLLPVVLLKSAAEPLAVFSVPVVLLCKRIIANGRVIVASGVAKERAKPLAVLPLPVVLLKSASHRWPCC